MLIPKQVKSSLLTAVVVGLVAFTINAESVLAVPMPISSGFLIPGTAWTVGFGDPVKLMFDPPPAENELNISGTLIDTTIRTNNNSTFITFQQAFPTGTSSVAGGLRLLFATDVTNSTGSAWADYRLELLDNVPAPNFPMSGTHPPQPHFHPGTSSATFAPFTTQGENLVEDVSDPLFPVLMAGDGKNVVPDGQPHLTISSLLIHEREFANPDLRAFTLVQTPVPVPEPSTWLLLGSGLAGLIAWHRRMQHR